MQKMRQSFGTSKGNTVAHATNSDPQKPRKASFDPPYSKQENQNLLSNPSDDFDASINQRDPQLPGGQQKVGQGQNNINVQAFATSQNQ